MTWWQAIILGIVQGVTEFLPVSSSGHLVFVERMLGVSEGDSVFFFAMLHIATIAAICVALTKSVFELVRFPVPKKVWLIAAATAPGVIAGIVFNDFIEQLFGGAWLWLMFLVTAAVLFCTELLSVRRAKQALAAGSDAPSAYNEPNADARLDTANADKAHSDTAEADAQQTEAKEITLKQALIMGCAQAVAIMPGISRSGSTICAGVLSGGERKKVADFSFLMSIPIILGSAVYEFIGLEGFGNLNFFCIALGMCAAFVSGLFSINLMMRIIAKANYKWFSVYLVVLSIVTLVFF